MPARGREAGERWNALASTFAVLIAWTVPSHAAEPNASAPDDSQETEIVVGGARVPTASRDRTAASTVIQRDQLEEPGATASQVLGRVPGLQVTQTGSAADVSTVSLRGSSANQVPVYLAGIRLNDEVSGVADLSTVPLWMLDRVEVYRGHGPLLLNRPGLAGTVSFEPRLPTQDELRLGGEVGSFGAMGLWGGVAVVAPTSSEIDPLQASSLLGVRHSGADNDFPYLDDRGTGFDTSDDRIVRRPNADDTTTDVWSVSRYAWGESGARTRVVTVLNAFDRERGVSGLGVRPAEHARARTRRLLFGASSLTNCDRLERCAFRFSASGVGIVHRTTDPRDEINLFAPEVDNVSRRLTVHGAFEKALTSTVGMTLDSSHEFETLRIDEWGAERARAERSTPRVGLALDWAPTSALFLIGSGQVGFVSTEGRESSDFSSEATSTEVFQPEGRLGASYLVSDAWELRGNLARTFRNPNLGELYGVSAATRGNSALKAERGVSVDLGALGTLDGALGTAWVEGFVFARRVDDLIALRRSSLGYVRPFNLGRARIIGLEASAGAELLRRVRLKTMATLLDPRDRSDGRLLQNDLIPFQSRLVASQLIELFGPWGDAIRMSAGVRFEYRSSRVADPAGLVVIDGHFITDALIGTALGDDLVLRGRVANVFDERRFDTLGFPLPGRSFHLNAEWTLH